MHALMNTTTVDPTPEPVSERVPIELLVDMDRSPLTEQTRSEPKLVHGTVAATAELTVLLSSGPRPARRAKSCLVAAEPGDNVLCSVSDGVVHILAVLDGASDTRVVTEGKLEVQAEGELALRANHLRLNAKTAMAAIEDLRVVGRSVEAQVAEKAAIFAERIESSASRFLQRAKQAFRFVEELEQVRAGNLDVRAEGLAAVRGDNTIVAARTLAKIDGAQVKIG